MANTEQTTAKYEEIIIQKNDFKPTFVWQDTKSFYKNQIPTIVLDGIVDGQEMLITLEGKPFSRFLQFMGLGKNRFMAMMYNKTTKVGRRGRLVQHKNYLGITKAQEALNREYPMASVKDFKLLSVNDKVTRITSADYIGVPHTLIQETIENRLHAEGVEFVKTTKFNGVSGTYQFTNTEATPKHLANVGSEIAHSISYLNQNSGDKSLKIFGGAVVLVCTNGMTSGKAMSELKVVHKLELPVLKRKIETQIGDILEKVRLLPKEFLKLRKYEVTKPEAEILVKSLPVPQYLQQAIWTRLFTNSKQTRNGISDWDGTMYGLYMAATYIASHAEEVQRSTNTVKRLDEIIAAKLSNVDSFHDVWKRREKILEASGAKKLEVTA